MRHRQRVRADRPGREEALDLVGPHRAVLVAGQAGDLGVAYQRRKAAQVLADVAAQHDQLAGRGAPGTSVRLSHRRHGIPSPPCAAGASWPSASRRRRGRPRRRPSSPTTSRTLTPDELPIAAVFLTGRPFAEADQRAAGLGWSAIAAAVLRVAGVGRRCPRRGLRPLLGPRHRRRRRPGRRRPRSRPGAGADARARSRAAFAAIEAASGPAAKAADPARRCSRDRAPRTAKGRRQGAQRATSGSGSARGSSRRPSPGPSTGRSTTSSGPACSTGDVGRDRRRWPATTRSRRRADALPPAQVHARLAGRGRRRDRPAARARSSGSRTSTTGSGPSSTSTATDVRLYSRDLHDISGQFPEVVEGARGLPWDGILDGEILAWRDGIVLPFLALQARLGRKAPSAAILAEVPVIYVAFDVLGLVGVAMAPCCRSSTSRSRSAGDASRRLDLPLADDGGTVRADRTS